MWRQREACRLSAQPSAFKTLLRAWARWLLRLYMFVRLHPKFRELFGGMMELVQVLHQLDLEAGVLARIHRRALFHCQNDRRRPERAMVAC